MKIGYVRLSMNIELDYNTASTGNAEGRITLIKAIIDAGHDIYLLSQTSLRDEKIIQGNDNNNDKIIDIKWMTSSKLHYHPNSYPDIDLDLLLVENGPDNTTFTDRYGNTFIRRFANVLNSYKGTVIIMNIHPDAPFPLHKLAFSKVQYSDKSNLYRIGESHPDHGWASWSEICKDKKLLLLVQSQDPHAYALMKDGKRQRFFEHNIPIDILPIVFDKSLVKKRLQKPIYKMVYMGYPRSRENEFEKYYTDLPVEVNTWGKWDSRSAKAKEFREKMELGGIVTHGFVEGQANITDLLSRSLMTVSIVPSRLQSCGYITHRNLETVHAGCINIGTSGVYGIEKYLDRHFIIESREELIEFILKTQLISKHKRRDINEMQLEKIKKFNGFYMLNYLIRKMQYAKELQIDGQSKQNKIS